MVHFMFYAQLLFDTCRWQVKEGDAEAVGGATAYYHRPLTNKPSWRLLVLQLLLLHKRVQRLLPLHRLLQRRAKEGLSNLQRFREHHPLTFKGEGDPMIADHWFRQVEKILEAMEIIFDATKIKLAVFQLEGESQIWWD